MSRRLEDLTTEELRAELERREPTTCPTCRRWVVVMTCSRSWQNEPHCSGCVRPVALCRCSR